MCWLGYIGRMLQVVLMGSPDDKKIYFAQNSSIEDLWIVSHMEAKKWLQEQHLKMSSSIPTQTVLRATEYWQWLFSINCPEWRVISESLIYAFIEDWFEKNKTPAQYSDIEMFYNFLTQVSPLLYSPQKQLFPEWLQQEPQRREKLFPWYSQAEAFQQTLNHKKWMGRPWLLSFLVGKEDVYFGESQKIHFDLGLDLQHEEVEIILRLSQEKDVSVLVPNPSWAGEYPFQLAVYNRLVEAADKKDTWPTEALAKPPQTVAENSVLKEVKRVVAQIRDLLNQGVQPQKIAIGTAALEDYWPLLKSHFDIEGVPLNKRVVARVISLPEVQIWLARLQLLKEDFHQAQLEAMLYFSESPKTTISYRDFKKNFTNVYETDILRQSFQLPEAISQHKNIRLADLVDILYAQWEQEDDEILGEIIDRLVKDMNLQDELTYPIWLKYLELVISRYEIPLFKEQEAGIQFYGINAMDWNECDYLFVLGCEQKLLVQTQRTPLQMEDLFAIERDLGFFLQKTENHKLEFDLRWCLEKKEQKAILIHSESDFNGDPQLASHYWMKTHLKAQTNKEALSIINTRWDEVMVSPTEAIAQSAGWNEQDVAVLTQKLVCEQSTESYPSVQYQQRPRLSASQFQKVDQCSFLFFAEKILKLKTQEEYDLEIDPMYNGQILHAVLEKLMLEKPSLNMTWDELSEIYEKVVLQMSSELPLQTFWRHEKKRQMNLIQNFIELEKEYRKTHPLVQTVGVEVPVQGYVTAIENSLVWSREPKNTSSFPFAGKIDRLDQDTHKNYAIVDYKTSKTENIKGFTSWLKQSQFQMSIYAQAVEAGLGQEIEPNRVAAAEYIFLKNKSRGSGFIINDEQNGFVSLEKPEKTVSIEDKEEHDQQLKEKLSQLIQQIERGSFPPKPQDVKICEKCQWSPLCRAPHLR